MILAWVRRELSQLGIPPLKRFGQHFLVDKMIRDELTNQAELGPDDTVLEVGPGLGFLTTTLASKAGRVIAVEKDRTLAEYLTAKFSKYPNVKVIQGDALKSPIPYHAKIVSSPPYNISSKLTLLITNSEFKSATLLLQEEFVKRLTASSGSREYGRITVMLQSKAEAKYVRKVPRSAFYPRPRVDSALVTLKPTNPPLPIDDLETFTDLVRALFTQRRRKLRGVLTRYLASKYQAQSDVILSRVTVAEKRVHELNISEFINLSNLIVDAVNRPRLEPAASGN
jgi:16S rRNA (adenine1518-N6/adenine1519-N6)-dimethyltransferase